MNPFNTPNGAIFGPAGTADPHRYALWRTLNPLHPGYLVVFCMLNPSTADATRNDPTIVRCINFAQAWGFGRILVVNLFAYRATDPRKLNGLPPEQAIGPHNDQHILSAARDAHMFVAAWGNHGQLHNRSAQVVDLLAGMQIHCLATTLANQPGHPLYLPKKGIPVIWTPPGAPDHEPKQQHRMD